MILHLGNDSVVYEKDIIMIIDSSCASARNTAEFLEGAAIIETGLTDGETAKSYVVTEGDGGREVHASPISSQTLWKRVQSSPGLSGSLLPD